jgi:hypothetical protein
MLQQRQCQQQWQQCSPEWQQAGLKPSAAAVASAALQHQRQHSLMFSATSQSDQAALG